MLDGKKSRSRENVYKALETGSQQVKVKPIELLDGALKNVKPSLEVRSRRVGGASYQVPVPVEESRQESLALGWIIRAARAKKGASFQKRLTDELVSAFKGEGDAVRLKQETERMAEANKAFAHFRW